MDGKAGVPGVCAWRVPGDCKKADYLMVAPLINNGRSGRGRPIIVRELEDLRLTCATSGDPTPTVSWNRVDGHTIIDGKNLRRKLK